MGIEIINPGLLTTVQDLGRYGFRKYGVIVSGAMDEVSHRIANLLVGNREEEAALEITLLGLEILIKEDTLIAICGGNLSPSINECKIPMWRPVYVRKGSILKFGKCVDGARAYIAFAGSFDIEKIMESKSTYLRGEIGGFEGRKLKKGDVIKLNKPHSEIMNFINILSKRVNSNGFAYPKWFINKSIYCKYSENPVVQVTKGGEINYFSEESIKSFFSEEFVITPQSDRMGYRLKGKMLTLKEPLEMISEAVSLGTVQVPPDGNPIILLADRQTTGGYPKLAEIISVDIPIIAQLKPGDNIKFQEVSLEYAQKLYIQREENIEELKTALKIKMKGER
ncbi:MULTISPECIES: biotin-dependent carboxyltransferase family protein [Clostridium]|uniref:KipI antagonist n=2 Tax=Clostridium TaxID=1485 RepID=A0A151ANH1_9CLOT|nr:MULTISPECIES: biotin-dependent carboxyltransferase family protein [Clostridium]KYH28957.1 KipI antagonist [Clostridium colicanis DSM 13634]PRR73231.1 KipI antagonist [Clostridium thermopalmarium DSM 5974]